MFTKHSHRTLLAVLAFVLVAAILGGALAGRRSSSGGFVAPGADSEVALRCLQAASGLHSSPAIALLVAPAARHGASARRARIPGVAQTSAPSPRIVTAGIPAQGHGARLVTKLGARDRAQLVVAAYETGLVVPGRREAPEQRTVGCAPRPA